MLFKKEFHDRIVRGEVTVTFRLWSQAKAVPGGHYRIARIGAITVDRLETVRINSITAADAAASGFTSVAELVGYLSKTSKRSLDKITEVFRVQFHYDRSYEWKTAESADPDDEALGRRLDAYDRRSRHGQWTRATLSLIARRRGTSSAVLAEILGRARPDLKIDIRKLKKLGLVRSLDVGYQITPLGRAVAARRRQNSNRKPSKVTAKR